MTSAAITVENLSKLYCLGASQSGGYRTVRESLIDLASAPWRRLKRWTSAVRSDSSHSEETLWALKDVSLDIEPEEVVGVIGRNGAGKSTFLKVLSRITEPTDGRVTLRGRIGSLLEVGTGFHNELTGRENIYLNGAVCGMSRNEINRKFDDIVEFSEIGRFLDTPVKRYSSGMFVRLAFAVASHMEPEILLVDEVLAVGDAAFQKKCLGKMNEVSRSGRTVLFVSHNMATILNLCEKVAVFDKGRLAYLGPCQKGVELYNQNCAAPQQSEIDLADHPNRRQGCARILGRLRLLNSCGVPTNQVLCGEPITVEVELNPECPVGEYHIAVGFDDTLSCRLFTAATYLSDTLRSPSRDMRRYVCRLDQLPLTPGSYALTLNAGPRLNVWTDVIDQALGFEVLPSDYYGNGRLPNADWGRFLMRSHWEGQAATK